jgi:hypothetical protein
MRGCLIHNAIGSQDLMEDHITLPTTVTDGHVVGIVGVGSATATAATPSTVAATAAATVSGHLNETRVNLLLGLLEDIDKVTSLLLVISSEKGNGGTHGTSTTGTTNSVNVVFRVVGIIVVQHVSDVAHIFTRMVSRRRRGLYSNVPAWKMKVDSDAYWHAVCTSLLAEMGQ